MYKHALLSNKFMIAIKIEVFPPPKQHCKASPFFTYIRGLPVNDCGGVAWEFTNKLHNSSTIKLSKMKG
jgi:hypothetical protein